MQKRAIRLEDLTTQDAEFTLSDGKTYTLRPATMEDFGWLQSKFGVGALARMSVNDIEKVSMVAYRLLNEKAQFPPSESEDFDDDGNPVVMKRTGPQVFARSLKGMRDFQVVIEAMNRALGTETIAAEIATGDLDQDEAKKNP